MKRFITFIFTLYTLHFTLYTAVYAGTPGTSAGLFLQEIPSVRIPGMGGASSGLGEDIAGIYTNPSGIGLFDRRGISLSLWSGFIPESRYYFAGFVYPTKKINLGLSYLGYTAGEEEIVEFDFSSRTIKLEEDIVLAFSIGRNIPLGNFTYKNLSLDRYLAGNFYAGVNFKYLKSTLAEDYSANTFTTDWALLWHNLPNKISLSAGVENLFGKLKYNNVTDSLPTTLRIGGTYLFQFRNDRFLFVLDLVKPNDDAGKQILGLEYYPLEIPSVRLRTGIGKQGEMNIFGLGFGLKIGNSDIDYAYTGSGEKDNPVRTTLHRIAFSAKFGSTAVFSTKKLNQTPRIIIESAEQQLSTTTVRIAYTVIDPDTGTVKVNLFYEDAGSISDCRTISGETGLVSTGLTHTVYWDAKTDYPEKEANIRLCVQADDLEGGTTAFYTGSFSLDTKVPIGKELAFVRQPAAGDSAITIQSQWEDPAGSVENISLVQFAYRKNDTEEITWQDGLYYQGTIFNLTDSRAGSLDGNDYINWIKAQAYDKYGNGPGAIENLIEKLVQPAVPGSPSVSAVYPSSITLIINPGETISDGKGLYYAFRATYTYENADYEKWADNNKNLSALSPVWQSLEPAGWNGPTVTVNGLEPGTTYYFSVSAGNPRIGAEPFTGVLPENSVSTYGLSAVAVTPKKE